MTDGTATVAGPVSPEIRWPRSAGGWRPCGPWPYTASEIR